MKKIFALFLACALLFLTACNITPSNGTTAPSGTPGGTEDSNPAEWWEGLQDQLVMGQHGTFMELPSRIVFEAEIDHEDMVFYYSKADGKAYVYCFDPLCDHTDYTCLGNPASNHSGWWYYSSTFFINDRFYSANRHGQIYSFAFDGSDKKLEYDAGYEIEEYAGMIRNDDYWGGIVNFGPYLYIESYDEENAGCRLRFNVETKVMDKVEFEIAPRFFYNGMFYGVGLGKATLETFYKGDMNFKEVELLGTSVSMKSYSGDSAPGHIILQSVSNERHEPTDPVEILGTSIYNLKTEERTFFSNEDLGLEGNPAFICATDQYFYFYESKKVALGTVVVETGSGPFEKTSYKSNPGKLYRMDLDGSNIVCVYDNPEYELGRNAIICGDRILMMGKYMCIEDKKTKSWGGILQAATINPDGTIGEFEEVEIVA